MSRSFHYGRAMTTVTYRVVRRDWAHPRRARFRRWLISVRTPLVMAAIVSGALYGIGLFSTL